MNLQAAADQAIRMVLEAPLIAYDTETSGLDWKTNQPVGYVVSTGDHSVYVPIRHGGGGNLPGVRPMMTPTDSGPIHPFEAELAKAFERRAQSARLTIGHNILFDAHFSANAGIMLGRHLACTQNNAAILDEYARSYSLENCALRANVEAKKGAELYQHLANQFGCLPNRKSMEHFWQLPGNDETGQSYAIGDGITTFQLYQQQMADIASQDLGAVCSLENQLVWTLFRMERRGIKVDTDYLDELIVTIQRQTDQAYVELDKPDFNPRAPSQVKEIMLDAGHDDWPVTAKGNASFPEKWLKKYSAGQKIVTIRKLTNLYNSFMRPLRDTHIHKGRVHAHLNQLKADDHGTISGRFSCSNPNLQQVPKRDKELAYIFRKAFVADKDCTFWERDYSQCEPRLFAHYSQDSSLVNGYCAEPFVDVHSVVAELLKVERDPTAKRMNMGILTGMQPKSFAAHMGWNLVEATDKFNEWFEAFPGVRDFQNRAKSVLRSRGYVRTLLNRRCRLEAPRFAYRGTSKIIQGGNADIIKWKLLEADRMCESSGDIVEVLMTVHDSFNGQYQNTPEARQLFKAIEEMWIDVQSPPFNLRVPFAMDGHDGPNWGVATFGDRG